MRVKDRIVVVTGAASGIGRALALKCAEEGAKTVICVDRDDPSAVAAECGGVGMTVDVSSEDQIKDMIDTVENDKWQAIWDINVMAHVWAARHLVPKMAARGGGYLLNTASAAGLLNQIGSAPYGVTKAAAVALGEWIALTYGDQGIKVSVLCPQAVRTEMTRGHEDHVASIDGMMEPGPVAEACLRTIEEETFLVLPHPEVAQYMRNKAENYDRWIGGMRKLNRKFGGFA